MTEIAISLSAPFTYGVYIYIMTMIHQLEFLGQGIAELGGVQGGKYHHRGSPNFKYGPSNTYK